MEDLDTVTKDIQSVFNREDYIESSFSSDKEFFSDKCCGVKLQC